MTRQPELRFISARGQLGVMREGYPSVWFDCPASKAFATAQYICHEYDAKMIDFAGVLGYIPPSMDTEKPSTAIES